MATQQKPADIIEHHEAVDEAAGAEHEDLALDAEAKGQGLTGYEHLTAWETIKAFKINTLICFLTSISAATDGYQIAMVGNIIANKGFIKQFGNKLNSEGEVTLAASTLSTFNALASVGQIVGMTTIPFVSSRFGRKGAMFHYWVILALSVIVECVARNWKVWVVAKFLGGIGVGSMQSTLPIYIAEIAPIRVRGVFLMCYSFWWMTGQFFAPIALQVMADKNPNNWLTAIYTQWSQIGLMFIIYLGLPESPLWCITKGKTEKAKQMIRYIYKGVDIDVEHQYRLMELVVQHERAEAAGRTEKWWAIFKGRDGFRTIVACWTLMTQQFIGLGVFLSFASYFFLQAGLEDPFKVVCITSGINIAAVVVTMYLADTTGRRSLACIGTTICWLMNVAVGILSVVPKNKATNNLVVVFAVFWNIGLMANGATGWAYIGEISSQRLRPYTAGFAAASSCVIGVIMSVLVPYMITETEWNWSLKTCWFFAGIGFPFTLGMWLLIPETSGRSVAELDELFERRIKPWRFHKTITMTERLAGANEKGSE
ncbi:MFS general substrate transporter [Aaosphaeria arxii CBS 175.79]|uniref:MFS general substrate transporter n=1 Tax=Aaosphaeria arxii CBS 175.79 TaxID=1450172 RepID=A0A6A5XIZ7_9PLEO|nr:MFS general substrate transporter [Aaosphaeria arxii CBS 175.79]KAF2012730.1 MFS general substrate transporter [Aaosphaeria arxii CBS 175.79]